MFRIVFQDQGIFKVILDSDRSQIYFAVLLDIQHNPGPTKTSESLRKI